MLAQFLNARTSPAALLTVALSLAATNLHADDTASATDEQIERWVLQLSDADFTTRRTAAAELVSQGAAAVDALAEAAQSGNGETALRCIDLLARLKESDDKSAVAQATAAIEALSVSDDAAVAQRAQSLLAEPPDVKELQQNRFNRNGGVRVRNIRLLGGPVPFDANGKRRAEIEEDGKSIVIEETQGQGIVVTTTETVDGEEQTTEIKAKHAQELRQKDKDAFRLYRRHLMQGGVRNQAQIQAQVFQMGVVNRRRKVSIINGVRTIEVVEDGKTIEIRHKNGKDITLKVTEKVGDKQETREFEAADLDELKENHPEAAEIYEKYSQQNGAAIQIQINGQPLQLNPLRPAPVPQPRQPEPDETDDDREAPADE